METIAADIFRMGCELATVAVEVYQYDVVASSQGCDASVPMLDCLLGLLLLRRCLTGEGRQAGQIGQACHNHGSMCIAVQLAQQRIEIMDVVLLSNTADEGIDDEPDSDKARRGGECE